MGFNSLLQIQAQVVASVGAETSCPLSEADAFGTVFPPVASLAVDLRLVSCHRGAVQSFPASHCGQGERGRVSTRLRTRDSGRVAEASLARPYSPRAAVETGLTVSTGFREAKMGQKPLRLPVSERVPHRGRSSHTPAVGSLANQVA